LAVGSMLSSLSLLRSKSDLLRSKRDLRLSQRMFGCKVHAQWPVYVECFFLRSPGHAPCGAKLACAKRATYPGAPPRGGAGGGGGGGGGGAVASCSSSNALLAQQLRGRLGREQPELVRAPRHGVSSDAATAAPHGGTPPHLTTPHGAPTPPV